MATLMLNEQRISRSLSRTNRGNSRRTASSNNNDESMEKILERLRSIPEAKMLKRIASLPDIRRGKALSIRSKLREGAYSVEDRWDRAIDQVLEIILA